MAEQAAARGKTIALVIDILAGSGSYQEEVWRATADACAEAGVGLLIFPGGALGGSPGNQYEHMKNLVYRLIRPESVDGVVLAVGNIINYSTPQEYAAFSHGFGKIPVVNIGQALDGIPGVVIENEAGMGRLLDHLLGDHAYRKVAFIRGPEANDDAIQRFRAYRQALQRHQLPYREELTYVGDFSEEGGARAVAAWLKDGRTDFDCVVASNDYMAIGAVRALTAQGRRVPQDVAVAGFDDIYEAGILSPGLTTVRQPLEVQMRRAVETLVTMMDRRPLDDPVVRIDTEIIRRQSCGCSSGSLTRFAHVRVWEGGDRRAWLEEVSLKLVTGFRRRVDASEMVDLFTALFEEIEGRKHDVFLPLWERFFDAHFQQTEDLTIITHLLTAFRTVVFTLAGEHSREAENLLYQAHNTLTLIVYRIDARKRAQVERLANTMSQAGLVVGGTFDLPGLGRALRQVLPSLGVNNFLLGLYQDPRDPLAGLRILAWMEDGRIEISDGDETAGALEALARKRSFLDRGGRGAVCPLVFEEEHIGLVFLELASNYGFMYETLVSQLSLALRGAKLVDKNVRARTQSEERTREIETLSLPMIESIRQISSIAAEKMESARELVQRTKESRGKITETNATIEKISTHMSRLLDIIQTIEEIADRVNLLALNTAIEAAHVGRAGLGFTVIAKEIKKLAETTGAHSSAIAAVLQEVVAAARQSSHHGQESLLVFQQQERGVDDMVASFRTIEEKMRNLGQGSENILKLMRRE